MVAGESLGRPVQDLGDEREAVLERLRLQGDASDEQAAADLDIWSFLERMSIRERAQTRIFHFALPARPPLPVLHALRVLAQLPTVAPPGCRVQQRGRQAETKRDLGVIFGFRGTRRTRNDNLHTP